MNFVRILPMHLRQIKFISPEVPYLSQICHYAVPGGLLTGKIKKGKKSMTGVGKIELPVETDPEKLVSFLCGSNLLKEGGEDIKLKPDSEYPEWLWNIRIGPPPKVEDLDPNTKAYWRKLRKQGLRRRNLQLKFRRY